MLITFDISLCIESKNPYNNTNNYNNNYDQNIQTRILRSTDTNDRKSHEYRKICTQGGILSQLGATIWLPLNGHDTSAALNGPIQPSHTIGDLQQLLTIIPIKEPIVRRNSIAQRPNRFRPNRFLTLPDFDNGNSNSSDGSWYPTPRNAHGHHLRITVFHIF